MRRDRQERGAEGEDRALDGDQRRQRRVLRSIGAAAGQPDDRQPGRRDRDAEPLPSSEMKAEEPLREDGQEDQPAREHGLDDRNGARASAPTCRTHARIATSHPIANHLERKSAAALRSGWRTLIGAATTAPRYFNRKAALVANADASASSSPRIIRPNGGDPPRSPAPLDGSAPNGRRTMGA